MKKVIIISILFLILCIPVVSALDSSNWSVVTIKNNDFKIPPQYSNGELKNDEYKFKDYNTFAIIELDENLLVANYGMWATTSEYSEKTIVGGHNVRYYYDYNSYAKDNVSHLYYNAGDSIYGIFWKGNEITPEIEEIINSSNKSNLDFDEFNAILDNAIDIHELKESNDLATQDTYVYIEDSSLNRHNQQIWYWYFMNRYY